MGNFKLIKCDNSKCDFWQDGNCFYSGTQEIKPNAKQEKQCKAFEPFREDDDYIREVNAAYWAEEEELKMGMHPSQIFDRVQHTLKESGCDGEITFMDYAIHGSRVIVSVNNSVYGVFDYEDNIFLSTPDERLTEVLEANGFGLYNNEDTNGGIDYGN